MGSPDAGNNESERIRRNLEIRDNQLAEKDRAILQLNRRLRKLENLRLLSESRAARLAEKERELSELKLELARRDRPAQSGRPR